MQFAKYNIKFSAATYQQLTDLANECGCSVADLVREGVGLVLIVAAEARVTGRPTLAILAPLARSRHPDSD